MCVFLFLFLFFLINRLEERERFPNNFYDVVSLCRAFVNTV